MKILCLDIGNTRYKASYYQGNELLWHKTTYTPQEITDLFLRDMPDRVMVSDVRGNADWIGEYFTNTQVMYVNSAMPLPITIAYATPETLGADRLAAAAGAAALYPNTSCLIFDCGTCMTIDFIDSKATYHGGAISPGLEMRLMAMHEFTGKLPAVEMALPESFVGNNTKACMRSGAFFGMLDEITGAIQRYEQQYGHIQAIITGGDAAMFAKHIKNNIFAPPNLVTEGLKHIAQHVPKGN